MHYKDELQKIIDMCQQTGTLWAEDSLLILLLFNAKFEKGKPLVKFVSELVDFGFNPFKHGGSYNTLLAIQNIIAVCEKELKTLKI